ncbi:glutathione S-transferase [Pasteurellaceae bacterium Macca]|nr:glutathione S-transferase [Pasteurellaceae bacterium Macca]
MITLYALKQSRAYRIAWLLELLELDYQLEIIERDKTTFLAPDSLRQLHPLGKSPLLQDGDLTLAESGAIVEYLIHRYGNALKPDGESPAFTDYLYWLHYAEGSLMPLLVMNLIFKRIDDRKVPFFIKPIVHKITQSVRESYLNPQLERHLDHIERHLQDKTWFLGETLSGADIMMSFPLQAIASRQSGYPNIQAYVARLTQHPAYLRAEQKLGKFHI